LPSNQRVVYDINPTMTMFNERTMEEIIDNSLVAKQLARLMFGSFALLLAAVASMASCRRSCSRARSAANQRRESTSIPDCRMAS